MKKRKQRMPFKDALDIVPDDLPDGAYFAMAHEIAGLDYGDGFEELADEPKVSQCGVCNKRFGSQQAKQKHIADKKHFRKKAGP